ncbi:MAG TPA: ATP-binding cassette domain-containing protein [Acidimicrobiia bacterium]
MRFWDIGTHHVIRTAGLTKVYRSKGGPTITAVDHLDLGVHGGEIFGLLGPNGAGKTTTVGMLTTRVLPTTGQAWVGDVDVVADPVAAKQMIGVVPQESTLDRALSVWENLYFHGRYFGMTARSAKRAADDALERFRLADRADAEILELSGGMAQRLMVARAVLHQPRLLFLDEPTAGLDPQSRLALWEVINELHADGQTILLTTHYMEEADQLCDRVAIMDHGRILALDAPAALKRTVAADTEIRITSPDSTRVPELAVHLEGFEGVKAVSSSDGLVRVYLHADHGGLARLIAHADAGGFDISDVKITEPTLEAVFISLTGKDLRE